MWQLAGFHCDSWQVFIVAVGNFSLWQLAGFNKKCFAFSRMEMEAEEVTHNLTT
ncbi:MAG: hypothetical protein IKP89_06595 [Bacteroidales bacterium]|nr:hypothetical protein [Bacteroidales bacterium]